MPSWSQYFYGGHPLLAIPEEPMFDLVLFFALVSKNIYIAMNLAMIAYFFLAGLGMYLLVDYLKKNKDAAFFSALVYMFNGFMIDFVVTGHINILESYALIPFALLFALKALKEEATVRNAIISGIFVAMQILGGGIIFFLYTSVILGLVIIFNLLGSGIKNRLIKSLITAVLIFAILFGLSAIKLLPSLDFVKISNRSIGVSFNEFTGTEKYLTERDFQPFKEPMFMDIGIIALILVAFSFASYKNRHVVFFFLLGLLSMLLIMFPSVQQLFYNYAPGFSKMRNIERAMIFFIVGTCVLAAFGFERIKDLIEKKAAKFSKIRLSKEFVGYAVLTVLVVLLLVDFSFFLAKRLNGFPGSVDFPDQLAGVGIMKYIGDEGKSTGEMFRVYNMAQKTVIGASGYHYYAQAGIEDAKGGGGIWINDYVTYLGTSEAYNFPNMLGNINIKYIISDSELNSDQLRFIQKFNECKTCSSWEAYGPYLYELKNYLPRASNFQKMVIFLGEKKNSDKAVYSIMANNLADLNKLALVSISSQKELDSISGEDLLRAGMIILVDSSLVQANAAKLQSYVSGGGKLAPDIFAGENNIEEGTLVSMLRNNSDSAYAQMKIEDYAPQKYSVALNGEKGLLLLAEKFFMFPDWKARVNGKEAMIFQVNAMDSGIFLDGQIGKLEVEYRPHAYNLGKPISIITLLFLIFYFSMHLIYGKKSKSRTIRFIIG